MTRDDRYQLLLMRRIPRHQIDAGCAYVIHARNGGVGVAVLDRGELGYRLHRVKFGFHYLFVEYDWDNGPPFGTVIPYQKIDEVPPTSEPELLAWLAEQEAKHASVIRDTWSMLLGTFTDTPS